MKVKELLKHFKSASNPIVAAAAYMDLHPETIRRWEKKDGNVPVQWEALFKQKKNSKS